MKKNYYLKILLVLVTIIFVFRLITLQLINPYYKSLSENNALIELPVFPERGYIYDRNGDILVSNKPGYDLMIIPENTSEFDTLELKNLLKLSYEDLKFRINKARTFSNKKPSVIISEISKENHATLQEKLWKYPGFYIQKKSLRYYPNPIASNILGYLSEVNENDLKKDYYYKSGELIGRQGIEKFYEKYLRGLKGKSFFQKDRYNRIIGSFENGKYDIKSKEANNLILTIDAKLQEYGEKLLKNKRGGIVAIEPKSGEILALISAPNYNPSLLVGRGRSINYKELLNDSISKPLFDRCLQAQYSPGSPFKLLNGLIALQEKVIQPKNKVVCNKGHFYAKNAFMECHCKIGTRNSLVSAIYKSCNTYFAKTFNKIINSKASPSDGLDTWKKHLNSFGLGDYLGYDLPIGKSGFIPDSDYYNNLYNKGGWKAPTIISNSIGQGEILVTPIQMANFTAVIANRGYYITPHFLKSINGNTDLKPFEKKVSTIDSLNFEPIISGMEKVVENGTAKIAKISGIEVCGKTGTVENFTLIKGKKTQLTDHSIFVAFAPKNNPKIAIAVYIENGFWGSRWAAPIASLMIEKHLNKSTKRKWLENRMINGSLINEYFKPYSKKDFKINE
tara:strand:- start:8819 stop:10681 length:1863 start_codon:yes stop_codon:yes gene_type:complete